MVIAFENVFSPLMVCAVSNVVKLLVSTLPLPLPPPLPPLLAIALSTYAFVAGFCASVGSGTNKLKRLVSVGLAL